jgi:hypothetical protein
MMNSIYKIESSYPKTINRLGEITISSDNIYYSEIENSSGCQVLNQDNQELIHKKMIEISKLIKEVDKLNKILNNGE